MSDPWGNRPQQPPPGGDPTWPAPPSRGPQQGQPGGYREPPTEHINRNAPQQPPQQPQYPSPHQQQPYSQPPPPSYPPPGQQPDGGDAPPPKKKKRGLTLAIIAAIVVVVLIAGLIGVELYARNEGNNRVATAAACLVEDSATASFGTFPPFLWQHLNKDYSSLSIETAGNNIRQAQGMKAEVEIEDLKLTEGGDSRGTIGSLNATITWTGDGISRTIEEFIPIIGSVVSEVQLSPSDGTVEVGSSLAGFIVKPEIKDGGIAFTLERLTGLGFALPEDEIQPALDGFTDDLNENYPLDIKADSIEVTDEGIVAKFSTQNATIESSGNSSECLDNL